MISYLSLIAFAILFTIIKINSFFYYTLTTSLLIVYSLTIRFSAFDLDINVYANSMESSKVSLYYFKEPVFWLGSRILYQILGSKELVFCFYDLLCFSLILFAQERLKFPRYFIFIVLIFFPSVMGMQNVYRQFIACSFLIFSIALVQTGSTKSSFIFFVLSGLSQNVGFLFFPLFFLFNFKNKRPSYKLLISAAGVLFLIPSAISSKSSSDTGVLGVEAYIVILVFILILYCSCSRWVLNTNFAKYFYAKVYFILLLLISAYFMGNAQSKRVGMICLLLTLIPFTAIIEKKFTNRIPARIIFVFAIAIPTFIFSSALSMLYS